MTELSRRAFGTILAGAVVTLAAGCNSSAQQESGKQPSASAGGGGGGFPVSITSAVGEATIPAPPKRVVTLGWGSDDACLALGVTPVAMAINLSESSDGLTPWARAKITGNRPTMINASGDNLPYEKIAAEQPDLILAVYSGLTPDQHKRLTAIAPTVGYPDQPWATSWPDQLEIVGRALGKVDQARAAQQRVEQLISAQAGKHPEFAGLTAMFGSVTKPGNFNLYFDSDPRMQLLGQLGFTVSKAATTTFVHGPSSPTFATTISLEELPKLDTDVLVTWYFDKKSAAQTAQQQVFGRLAAVKNKAYVPLTDSAQVFASSAPNVLSIPWMLPQYVASLASAAANAQKAK